LKRLEGEVVVGVPFTEREHFLICRGIGYRRNFRKRFKHVLQGKDALFLCVNRKVYGDVDLVLEIGDRRLQRSVHEEERRHHRERNSRH
jgi:hypothetical protein